MRMNMRPLVEGSRDWTLWWWGPGIEPSGGGVQNVLESGLVALAQPNQQGLHGAVRVKEEKLSPLLVTVLSPVSPLQYDSHKYKSHSFSVSAMLFSMTLSWWDRMKTSINEFMRCYPVGNNTS